MKKIKKIHLVFNTNNYCITKSRNQSEYDYSLFADGARSMYFIMSIPLIGNFVALIAFVASCFRSVALELNTKEKEIIATNIQRSTKRGKLK